MFKKFKIIAFVLAGVGIGSIAHAQNAATTLPEVGAYEALSASDQKIAEALFNSQVVTADGKEPLNLDRIAASKQRSGWGLIFKQLKADGLLDAKNLRDLTSGRYQRRSRAKSRRSRRPARATVVTTASGRQIIVRKKSKAPRNNGRGIKRRGSEESGKHTDALFSHGGTYRGRLDNLGEGGNASSLGIATGKGVGSSSNVIMIEPK